MSKTYPHICSVHYEIDRLSLNIMDGLYKDEEELFSIAKQINELVIIATNMGQSMENKLKTYKVQSDKQAKIIIDELEVRIAYTENQLKLRQQELRKVEDSIKTIEGELIAYNSLLDKLKAGDGK